MKILLELARDRYSLMSRFVNTQPVRDEHLFKLFVYSPYRKQDINVWCTHFNKALNQLPTYKGISKNKLHRFISNWVKGDWEDDFSKWVYGMRKQLEFEGYPKDININLSTLFKSFNTFYDWWINGIIDNHIFTPSEIKQFVIPMIDNYQESLGDII